MAARLNYDWCRHYRKVYSLDQEEFPVYDWDGRRGSREYTDSGLSPAKSGRCRSIYEEIHYKRSLRDMDYD